MQPGQARGLPLNPRGPILRAAVLPEPQLYSRMQLILCDAEGTLNLAQMVPKCPVALAAGDACDGCQMVRSGMITKHKVISTGFPVAMSGVPRMRCQTHKRSFHVLHPLVYEALPADILIQPELVVLTEDVVLLKDAYLALGAQVRSSWLLHVSTAPVLLYSCMHACVRAQSLSCILRPWTLATLRRWRPRARGGAPVSLRLTFSSGAGGPSALCQTHSVPL